MIQKPVCVHNKHMVVAPMQYLNGLQYWNINHKCNFLELANISQLLQGITRFGTELSLGTLIFPETQPGTCRFLLLYK